MVMNYSQYLTETSKARQLAVNKNPPSIQSRFDEKQSAQYWTLLTNFCQASDSLGEIGSKSRDLKLQPLWMNEPILAGIIYTQQARLAAMHWSVGGGKQAVNFYTRMFQNLGYGVGWDTEIKKWAQDYLTFSRGALWEKGREGGPDGPVVGLAYMDMGKCDLWGNVQYPIIYYPTNGRAIHMRREDIIHRCAMPSGREEKAGAGICLVDRAIRAIKLLMALHKYEEDQLDDMPPDGICGITGMDQASVEQSMEVWKEKRDSKDLSFRRILWMVGNPLSTQPVHLEWHPFSILPQDFSRREVIETYVKTVALCAGEDPNEFWLFVHTGATKGIGTILDDKAHGKGVSEMASVVERAFNSEVLPEGVEFNFDYRDKTAQRLELERKQYAINNVIRLWEPPVGQVAGMIPLAVGVRMLVREQVITADDAKEIIDNAPDITTQPDVGVSTDQEGVIARGGPAAPTDEGTDVQGKELTQLQLQQQTKNILVDLQEKSKHLGEMIERSKKSES